MFSVQYKNKSIIAIADTHGHHNNLNIPACDILIHCGDVCMDGDANQMRDFFKWFSTRPAQYKLFVYGNHDYPFVFEPEEAKKLCLNHGIILLKDCMKTLLGITFYGLKSDYNLQEQPLIMNNKIDFVLSHIPPKNILDAGIGCSILLQFIKEQKPNYHIFGHAHKFGGEHLKKNNTTFINAGVFEKYI